MENTDCHSLCHLLCHLLCHSLCHLLSRFSCTTRLLRDKPGVLAGPEPPRRAERGPCTAPKRMRSTLKSSSSSLLLPPEQPEVLDTPHQPRDLLFTPSFAKGTPWGARGPQEELVANLIWEREFRCTGALDTGQSTGRARAPSSTASPWVGHSQSKWNKEGRRCLGVWKCSPGAPATANNQQSHFPAKEHGLDTAAAAAQLQGWRIQTWDHQSGGVGRSLLPLLISLFHRAL